MTAYTLSYSAEAIGVVRAARTHGIPVTVSFTVETDGRLPDGSTVGEAIACVDASAPPDYFLLNCAHPDHIAAGAAPSTTWERIGGVRYNASRLPRPAR